MSTERWLPVVGYEGVYEVSDAGRLRGLPRTVRGGSALRPLPMRYLTGRPNKLCGWHVQVTLSVGGVRRHVYLHRLVLEAFAGPCPDGMEACHFDDNPSNNALSNLRWDTRDGNMADRQRHGTVLRGEQITNSKLTEEEVRVIRSSGERRRLLAIRYGVSRSLIDQIKLRMIWRHVA